MGRLEGPRANSLVLDTAAQTVAAFRAVWAREHAHLPISLAVAEAVERQLSIVPLAKV